MQRGTVEAIHIGPAEGGGLHPVPEVAAVAGQGLEGDRYFNMQGTRPGKKKRPGREVTLIECEAIAAARTEVPAIRSGDSRRNIETRGVALNHLVGREFRIGEAVLRGIELCEPCGYLERLTHPGIRKALIHRGGLNADIVRSGVIKVGDEIVVD